MYNADAKGWGITMPDGRLWRCLGRVAATRRDGRELLRQKWSTPCLSCGGDLVLIKPAPRGEQPSVPFQRTLCVRCSRVAAAAKRAATWAAKQANKAARQAAYEAAKQAAYEEVFGRRRAMNRTRSRASRMKT